MQDILHYIIVIKPQSKNKQRMNIEPIYFSSTETIISFPPQMNGYDNQTSVGLLMHKSRL